jgi:cation diffusion facilitator CzcD-associated flavoprotein CzcO
VFDERARRRLRRAPSLQKLNRAFNWIAMDLFFSTGWLNHHRFPWIIEKIEQALIRRMRRQVQDPKVQEKLIPHYNFFCKRPSMSETFYPMFNRPNVELVTERIDRVTETGITTEDGVHRPVDVLICATGYKIFDRTSMPTFEVEGRGGRNLGDWWAENRYQAFHGTTMPGFPNFFMLVGPYAASGASYFDTLSSQVAHISRCLRAMRTKGARRIEVRQEAHDRDFAFVQRRGAHGVLLHGDCAASRSYYLDSRGDAPVIRPVSPSEHWLKTRLFSIPRSYHLDP